MQKSRWAAAAPYLYILIGVVTIFLVVGRFPPIRVGDGSEYYGLYYAWAAGHRPWMTPLAFDAFGALSRSNSVFGLLSQEQLAAAFTKLRVAGTADFNHFWFYSLLAFLCAKAAGLAGISLGAHQAFVLLHCVALSATACLSYRFYRWQGVLAVALMVLASPVFWFIDKAHTEFLTVCLVLSSMILMLARRYVAAALLIALASTQNPSFALVACIPLFYRVVLDRIQPYRFAEVAMGVATVVAMLAHPVYYFCRYGVVTPQLLAGGASMGSNLSSFYVWIVDPDVGLLPNWPLGLLVLACAILCAVLLRRANAAGGARDVRWWAFVVLYLLINFYAHSSTINLNSGATPGLARYALWYLPLAFPVFLFVFRQFPLKSRPALAAVPVLAALFALSIVVNDPRKPEQFSEGSLSSRFIQSHLLWLYNPPSEIFLERYSGLGEGTYALNPRVILGPDCRKMLVRPGEGMHNALASPDCMFDQAKLDAYVNDAQFVRNVVGTHKDEFYGRVPDNAADALERVVPTGLHGVGLAGDGGTILGSGWSGREDWGVWSQQKQATLLLPCKAGDGGVTVALKLRPFNKQKLIISENGATLWSGAVTVPDQNVQFELAAGACKDRRHVIVFDIPDAVSPLQLGLSGDARLLGIGLSFYDIRPH